MEAGFEEGRLKEFASATYGKGAVYDISLSARNFQFLRLRLKNKRAMRRKMRMSLPITPPMIASIGCLTMVVEELDTELERDMLVPDASGPEDVEDGPSPSC